MCGSHDWVLLPVAVWCAQGKPCLVLANKCDLTPLQPDSLAQVEEALGWTQLQGACQVWGVGGWVGGR